MVEEQKYFYLLVYNSGDVLVGDVPFNKEMTEIVGPTLIKRSHDKFIMEFVSALHRQCYLKGLGTWKINEKGKLRFTIIVQR